MSKATITERDFTTKYSDQRSFPFYEDENASGVYGYGHGDAQEFADAVNEYDQLCGEGDDPYSGEDVMFGWAVVVDNPSMKFAWKRADETTKDSFPMMWVNR